MTVKSNHIIALVLVGFLTGYVLALPIRDK